MGKKITHNPVTSCHLLYLNLIRFFFTSTYSHCLIFFSSFQFSNIVFKFIFTLWTGNIVTWYEIPEVWKDISWKISHQSLNPYLPVPPCRGESYQQTGSSSLYMYTATPKYIFFSMFSFYANGSVYYSQYRTLFTYCILKIIPLQNINLWANFSWHCRCLKVRLHRGAPSSAHWWAFRWFQFFTTTAVWQWVNLKRSYPRNGTACQIYRAAIFRVVPKPTSVGIIPMHNPTIKIEDAQSPTPCHQIVYESSFNFCASDWWKIFLGKGLFIFFCFYFSSVWSWASLHWLSRCLYFIFCKLYIFLLCVGPLSVI